MNIEQDKAAIELENKLEKLEKRIEHLEAENEQLLSIATRIASDDIRERRGIIPDAKALLEKVRKTS